MCFVLQMKIGSEEMRVDFLERQFLRVAAIPRLVREGGPEGKE